MCARRPHSPASAPPGGPTLFTLTADPLISDCTNVRPVNIRGVSLMRRVFTAASTLLFACCLSGGAVLAQDASPVASSTATPIATGLTTPRGFVWGPDGSLYVALAG